MKKRDFSFITKNNNTGLVIAVLILFIVLSVTTKSFLTELNLYTLGRTLSVYIIIGLSQAIALVIGNMNLSVGAIGAMATVTVGYCLETLGLPGYVAVLIAICIGMAAGFFNGIIIAKFGINSFVVTLSTMFFYNGLVWGFTKGYPYNKIPASFLSAGKEKLLGVPVLVYISIAILVIVFLFFRFSVSGRRMLATGENLVTAKFSGINTDRTIILSHILSGLAAAIAAAMYVSRIGSANPNTGSDWMVVSFAVSILGGTALSGGVITALGLFLGGTLLVLIKSGLVFLKVDVNWEQAFMGIIILLAILIDRFRNIYNTRKKIA